MSFTSLFLYSLTAFVSFLYIKFTFFNTHKQQQKNTNSKKSDIKKIPGPISYPFIGTRWIYFWKYKLSQFVDVHIDFHKRYGSIVLEVLPNGYPIVNLYDRKDIEVVLRKASKYPFRPPVEIVVHYRNQYPERYASTGLTNEQGEKWHFLRAKLTPKLNSTAILQAFLPKLNEVCDDFIDLLKLKRVNGIVTDFQDWANLMGLEAICYLVLDRRMGFLSAEPNPDIVKLAKAVKTLFITQRDSTFGSSLWKYIPTKTYREFCESEEIIYNKISDIIDSASNDVTLNDVDTVFTSILKDEELDVRDKKSAIIDFIAAGIETFANTLSFVIYYITQKKDTQQRILSEFQDLGDREILQDQLNNAKYTKACIDECYRICPTACCLARMLEEDAELSKFKLNAGTLLLCHTMISCQDENNFRDAKTYNPDRWIMEDEIKREPGTSMVLPFGVGKRTCPGRRFVDMELKLILAKLVRQFELKFCGELNYEFEFLLTPKPPINIMLIDRS